MKFRIVIVVFVLTLAVISGGFCFGEEFYSAQVRDISDREYEEAVIELIDNAKESIVVGMYYISTRLETNNPVKLLLNDLLEAEERGVIRPLSMWGKSFCEIFTPRRLGHGNQMS